MAQRTNSFVQFLTQHAYLILIATGLLIAIVLNGFEHRTPPLRQEMGPVISTTSYGASFRAESNGVAWLTTFTLFSALLALLPLVVAVRGTKSRKQLLVIFVAALALTACARHNAQAPHEPADHSESADLEASTNAMEQPNKYQVALHWQEDPKAIAWLISRADHTDSKPLQLQTLGKDERSFVDERVQAGESYRYVLTSVQKDEYVAGKEITVNVPLDLEVTGILVTKEIKGINRLFIRRFAKIRSNGESLAIDVNDIIADMGVISIFPTLQTAALSVPGRPAKSIHLHAKTGQGTLFISSRGENGGKGEKGCSGARGGDAGTVLVEIEDPTQVRIYPRTDGGFGGDGGEAAAGPGMAGVGAPCCLRMGSYRTPDCDLLTGKQGDL